MLLLDCEQGSDEWKAARRGIITGTGFSNILTPGTLKQSASAIPYMAKLLAEYVTGEEQERFSTPDTERGIIMEPKACQMYSAMTGNIVEHVGMVYRDDKKDRACSPDGLVSAPVGSDGVAYPVYKGLEIKCPQLKTHIGYVLKGELPNDYKLQVHGCMYVTGLDEWDFMSFHPDFRPLIVTIERDEKIDKAHARMILEDPSLACGYQRDAQHVVSQEAYEKGE